MDTLTDILRVADVTGRALHQGAFAVPWGVLFEADEAAGPVLHVVADGACCLRAGGHLPEDLAPGDLVLMAQGGAHILSDHPESRALTLTRARDRNAALMQTHDGATATLLSVAYTVTLMDPAPLLRALPEPLILRAETIARHPQLALMVQLMRTEAVAPGAGSGLIVPRLLDSLLALVLRTYIMEAPHMIGPSWLRGLTDPNIAQVLDDLHADPAEGWTLNTMSLSAGLSRAAFARRFAETVGATPKAYLNTWRLELAAARIRADDIPIEEASAAYGYKSPAAFSRAFRRLFGIAPSDLRKPDTGAAPVVRATIPAVSVDEPDLTPPAFVSISA